MLFLKVAVPPAILIPLTSEEAFVLPEVRECTLLRSMTFVPVEELK
jgi:hypothetical protein